MKLILSSTIFAVAISTANAWWFTGGPVFDPLKNIMNQLQIIVEQEKANLLNTQTDQARDQQAKFTAMEKLWGDGTNITSYVPGSEIDVDPQMQKAIDEYTTTLPESPEGEIIRTYLKRQNDRDALLAVYSQRVKTIAAAQGRDSLTMEQLVSIGNQLESQGMEARLNQIQEHADSAGTKAVVREQQLEMQQYRLDRAAMEAVFQK